MDFKIGDEIEENGSASKKPYNKRISIIIIVGISLLCGLLVFLVSNAIFGKKEVKVEPKPDTQLEITDRDVQTLYSYVTHGTRGQRNEKYLKEQKVTLDSFSNQERFYYALKFASENDFVDTGKVDANKRKVYMIPSATIKKYMELYFGDKVTYSTNSTITYPFNFKKDEKNLGTMTYSLDSDSYEVVFTEFQDKIKDEEIVKPYYAALVSATKKGDDNSIILEEKVIYTDVRKDNNMYKINIYKDYEHTALLETKQNLTEEQLKENPITMDNYKDKGATITYIFKANSNNYYFDSSTITN